MQSLRLSAGLVRQYLSEVGSKLDVQAALRARLADLIAARGIEAVLQPIVELATRRTVRFKRSRISPHLTEARFAGSATPTRLGCAPSSSSPRSALP